MQRRRVVENGQHFAQALLRLVQFAGLFLQLAEIVKDLGADLQAILQSADRRPCACSTRDGFLGPAQRAQLAGIAIAGLEIARDPVRGRGGKLARASSRRSRAKYSGMSVR